MRIVFVDNLLFDKRNGSLHFDFQPHMGLISLISVVRSGGHEGLLFDPKFHVAKTEGGQLIAGLYDRLAARIVQMNPDVVGFTSLGCNFICTASIAARIKNLQPSMPILLGGPHATILEKEILRAFPQFDVIVRHEAENVILPLLEALSQPKLFARLPSISYRRGSLVMSNPGGLGPIDIEALPTAAYDSYPIQELQLKTLRIEAGRGCPFECTFCSTAEFFGRRYRLKSPERLTDELILLNNKYGISDFALTHDLFTVDKKKVLAFCESVESLNFTWSCSARMDCVDEHLLKRMAESGCRSIYYGIETGSARMQKVTRKRQDLSEFGRKLDQTHANSMAATVSFIVGYPEENEADQTATLDLAGSCFLRTEERINVQVHLLTPEPGTALMRQHSSTLKYDGHISDFLFPNIEPADSECIRENPDIFPNHFYYESALPRARHIFASFTFDFVQGLHWAVRAKLIEAFSGNLGTLTDLAYLRATAKNRMASFAPHLILEEIEAQEGIGSLLGSGVRYCQMVDELASPMQEKASRKVSNNVESIHYVLRHTVGVLQNCHDCDSIINCEPSRLAQAWESARIGEKGNFILDVSFDNEQMGVVTRHRVDEDTASACLFFKKPKSREEFADRFDQIEDIDEALAFLGDHFLECKPHRRARGTLKAS